MIDKREIEAALNEVMDPELKKSLVELDMVRDIQVDGRGNIKVEIVLTISGCPLRVQIRREVTDKLKAIPGVGNVDVHLGTMTDEERQRLVGKMQGEKPRAALMENPVRVIGIASGKGGVGKSTVTINLAVALAQKGHSVGIMDADIWGFSIPRMIGLHQQPTAIDGMIVPPEKDGIKVMSMGFFVAEETPVIWRGPLVHKAVDQFLNQVCWGDLDYLLVDLPPGTGDVTISMAKMLPKIKMVIVTTPQAAAAKVASRAAHLAEKANLDVIGVIENMSYLSCKNCAEKNYIFGQGGGSKLAMELGAPFLGEVPLEPGVREGGDEGNPVVIRNPQSEAALEFSKIAQALVWTLSLDEKAEMQR